MFGFFVTWPTTIPFVLYLEMIKYIIVSLRIFFFVCLILFCDNCISKNNNDVSVCVRICICIYIYYAIKSELI